MVADKIKLTAVEKEILEYLSKKPRSIFELAKLVDLPFYCTTLKIDYFEYIGFIKKIKKIFKSKIEITERGMEYLLTNYDF